jgi:hypothetical protein
LLAFKRDLPALIAKETAASATAVAKLAELRADRDGALLNDDPAVLEKHDADVLALERQIGRHQARLDKLGNELIREQRADAERDRQTKVDRVETDQRHRRRCHGPMSLDMKKMKIDTIQPRPVLGKGVEPRLHEPASQNRLANTQ